MEKKQHKVNWEEIKILDKEKKWLERKFKEAARWLYKPE